MNSHSLYAVGPRQGTVGGQDGNGMSNDRVSIKIVDDIPATGDCGALEKGAELMVDSPTATALVLSGTAIQLPR